MTVSREGLGEEPAEAGAGAGDEDYLFGIHGEASMKTYSARGRCRSKVGLKRRNRGGLNAESAEEARRVRREDCATKGSGCTVSAVLLAIQRSLLNF